jgi:hypothetical protein
VTKPADVFQCKASYLVYPGGFEIFVHIPMAKAEDTFNLFRYRHIPVPISANISIWKKPQHNMPRLTGNLSNVDWSKEKREFKHLADLPLHKMADGDVPDILLGLDNIHVHALDLRRGRKSEPYAELTALGWVVRGNPKNSPNNSEEEEQAIFMSVLQCQKLQTNSLRQKGLAQNTSHR